MNIYQRIRLKIFGYYKDGYDYYAICKIHGLTIHIEQGFYHVLYCKKCIDDYIGREFKEYLEEKKNL